MNGDHHLNMPTRRFPRAACLGQTDTFFPSNIEELFDRAKAICATCPDLAPCREAGMAESYGVWGGLTPPERRKLHRAARNQAQPSADEWLTAGEIASGLGMHHATVHSRIKQLQAEGTATPRLVTQHNRTISLWSPETRAMIAGFRQRST